MSPTVTMSQARAALRLPLAANRGEGVRLSGRVGGRCLSVWFGAWKTSRPFWLALSLGDVGALRAALRGGQDINARNADGFTALMLASVSGDARMVLFLLEQGANVSALHHITNSSALDITEFVEADVMKEKGSKGRSWQAKHPEHLYSELAAYAEIVQLLTKAEACTRAAAEQEGTRAASRKE